LTTTFQKFTIPITFPSISGKTLGSNNDDYVEVNFWFDAGSSSNARTNSLGQQSGTFDIAQVQLEAGSVATPFEMRPLGIELSMCQRYYEKSYELTTTPGTATYVGMVGGIVYITSRRAISIYFSSPKRAIPTLAIWDGAGNSNKCSGRNTESWVDNQAVTTPISYSKNFMLDGNDSGPVATFIHYTASAEL